MTPALRASIAAALHAEHPANPGDDLRRTEDRRDADDGTDHPAPGNPADGRRDREADDDQDRDWRRDRQREVHQRVRAGIKGRGPEPSRLPRSTRPPLRSSARRDTRHGEKEGIVASITPCVVVRVIRPRLPTPQEGRFPGKCPSYLSQCDECAESAEMRDIVSAYRVDDRRA